MIEVGHKIEVRLMRVLGDQLLYTGKSRPGHCNASHCVNQSVG